MGWPSYLSSIVCACASVRAVFLCFYEDSVSIQNGFVCVMYLLDALGVWPLHAIAITNSVWFMLQWRGVGGSFILRNSPGDAGGQWGA